MAVFTETIVLDDKVSAAAMGASKAVAGLAGGLEAANKTLAGTETIADKAFKPFAKTQPMRGPGGKFVKGGGGAGEPALPIAPALKEPAIPKGGGENLTAKMLADQAKAQAAQPKGPIPSVGGKLAFDAGSYKQAQAVAGELQDRLKNLEKEMIRTAALGGDPKTMIGLVQSAEETKAALAKLPPATQPVKHSLSDMWADAAHAAQVGKEIIGAAADGIKAAFSSLAQGDAKGAVMGLTDAVAGLAKSLDLVVPGLGELVSAVVKIAGGMAAVTVGLVQAGMEFAIAASQGKTASIAMFTALGNGVTTGEEVDDMLSNLADQIGISKDELGKLTQGFMQMGITGTAELEKLTIAAQSAVAITGSPAGAEAFEALTKKITLAAEAGGKFKLGQKQLLALNKMGITAADVAGKMGLKTGELTKGLEAGTIDAKKFGDAMNDALIEKGKGPLDKMSNSLASIKGRFMQMWTDIFEDIDVGPFMHEVKSLFETIFSGGENSGKVLKAGIGGFFQKAFDLATKVVPIVKHFLLYIILYGMKAYNALFPIIRAFVLLGRTISTALTPMFDQASDGSQGFFDTLIGAFQMIAPYIAKGITMFGELVASLLSNQTFIDAVGTAFKAIAVVIGVVIGIIAVVIASFIAFTAIIIGLEAGLVLLAAYIGNMIQEAIGALAEWASGAADAAMNFITGLVNGIANGAGMVADAVKNVASGALDAFTGMLGIKSPSTVMFGMGMNIAEGAAGGIGAGAPDVHGAASDMAQLAATGVANGAAAVSPAVAASAQALGAGAPGAGGSGVTIVIEAGAISISGQGKDWAEVSEEMIQGVMERLGMQAGVT